MPAVTPDHALERLHWRYAVKQFDPARKIAPDVWANLEESLVLSPSSYGLQPWKFFVVNDPAIREKLLSASWNQKQIVDASHLVVFCVKAHVGAAEAERLIQRSSAVRGIPLTALDGYKKMMTGSLTRATPEHVREWMTRQVFIALGFFLTAAAMIGVDTCPMEGFEHEKYDHILGLSAKGYHSVVVATAGYRAETDAYAKLPKVRYEKSELVETI
ncbi:NAD(P)H-dependent oxidoreductase [Limnoglobus roseus]|uniref:NAD(P)H-dependent oxidoreductase n=1 Tax=Limnoglobus roseus TaxID=2598579 RepID=A0A5C1AF48_9BACT|nr:NAD(P)H-dependent oxidoreductase [Limnoglobus roseus]QEL17185.1 NAD(P)H-dependent oxidoreductase [Limnoglobus roseus]